ncbi:Peptidoglycan/xylan/chitin deacetylase, PgdA/CDA1 family [Aneurinibacillus thermoaerophilus]|uniref:Peptidoglycan/xylan/chitin deacetylase, PgdA/CDA1 family n=1 Tax=Aneurinibacillus thermoaerophilus TaxID=143495 RepID=A0A1G8CYW7_ANETH|nr:Peptidoglycan/xylan/chitin deacetylase, PgdA/CDA1 family [Aneurinibacillus thermoaerophilus]
MKLFVSLIATLLCCWATVFPAAPAISKSTASPIYHVDTKRKLIALTFDDGPHPVYTAKLLNILDKYHAKATFFVVGQRAKWYPRVIRDINRRGHEIGNHTFTHPRMKNITTARLRDEIRKTDQVIYSLIGKHPRFFRPPGGEVTYTVLLSSTKQKHPVVIWSYHQDTRDWAHPGIDYIVNKVTSGAKPGDIILFHDSGIDQTQTLLAVEKILPILSKKGYKFVTLSHLLQEKER